MLSRRGLFGLGAGMCAVPFVRTENKAASFPVRGSEPCTLKWFNRVRGFGFAHGELSGHSIFVQASCFEKAEITPRMGERYFVAWKVKPSRDNYPFAYEVAEW